MDSSSFMSCCSSNEDFMEKLYYSASDDDSFQSALHVSDEGSFHSAMDTSDVSMGDRSKLSWNGDKEGSSSYSDEEARHTDESNSLDPSEESSSFDMADSDAASMQLSMPSFTVSLEDSHFSVECTNEENASGERTLDKSFFDFEYHAARPSHGDSTDGAASFHLNAVQGEGMEAKDDVSVRSALMSASGTGSLTCDVAAMVMAAAMAEPLPSEEAGVAICDKPHTAPRTPVETRSRRTRKASSGALEAGTSAAKLAPPRKQRAHRVTDKASGQSFQEGQIVHFPAKPTKGHPPYYYTGQIVQQILDKNGALGYIVRYAYFTSLKMDNWRFYKNTKPDFICASALIADGIDARMFVQRTNQRYRTAVKRMACRKNADGRRTGDIAKRV
ncbi:uncharacterized protein LOC129594692 [Paramacrobiotus metropolitanus]|uniref:uncharacterized protein LOC129594692 n=1 Tax=Paramacrobiotus metropolitanus TaxID=2943436 RepID=UPI002445C4EA|nr:uncharacterized protein LOC129594692 [Paramacrobiotus metropolitanus]